MPQIINALASGNESIANSLSKVGEGMFGNTDQKQLYAAHAALAKEQTAKALRHNQYAQPLADAIRAGDRNSIAALSSLSDRSGVDAGNYNLLATANHSSGVDDPGLATAQLGAHEPIASTAIGQGRSLANAAAMNAATNATSRANNTDTNRQSGINQQTMSDRSAASALAVMERQVQAQQWTDEHTLVNLRGPDGRITMVPKHQVPNLQAHGYDVMPTLDQAKVNILSPQQPALPGAAPQQPTMAPPAAAPQTQLAQPASAPPEPAGIPPVVQQALAQPAPAEAPIPATSAMTPDQRSLVGLPTNVQSYQHPQTGEIAVSHDGGLTMTAPDGKRKLVAGSGFMPVSHEAALGQARTNSAITQAATPLPAPPTEYPQSAMDASKAAGADAVIQHEWNKIYGALTGGEVGANFNRARENLENLAMNTRAIVAGSPGTRMALKDRELAMGNMPHPGWFGSTGASGQEERNSTMSFIQGLRRLYASEQAEATDRNTPPQDVEKLTSHMRSLRGVIEQWEAPAATAAAAPAAKPAEAAAPAAAPQAAIPPRAQNIKVINGKTMYTLDGKVMQQ